MEAAAGVRGTSAADIFLSGLVKSPFPSLQNQKGERTLLQRADEKDG